MISEQGVFPPAPVTRMLVATRLRHIAGTKWGTRAYMAMELLLAKPVRRKAAYERRSKPPVDRECEIFLPLPEERESADRGDAGRAKSTSQTSVPVTAASVRARNLTRRRACQRDRALASPSST